VTIIDCLYGRFDPLSFVLFFGTLMLLYILWRVQKSVNQVDFVDLVLGADGKASWSKMTGIGGFFIGTWIVTYETLHDKLSDFMFLSYFAVCVGSPVAFGIINRGQGREQSKECDPNERSP